MNPYETPHYGSHYLHFLSVDQSDYGNLKKWQIARRKVTDSLFHIAQCSFVDEMPEIPGEPHGCSLSRANILFSLLAILVSEEFDEILKAVTKGTIREDYEKENVLRWVSQCSRSIDDRYGLAPVRIFDNREKEMILAPPRSNLSFASWQVNHRILISFDPFITPEDAARHVKKIVKQWQEERFSEDKKLHLECGYSKEQADMLATQDRLETDYPRAKNGKRSRGARILSDWLRRLRVYQASVRDKESSSVICEYPWWINGQDNASLISKDVKNAREFIRRVLCYTPIMGIKTIA